VAVTGEKEPADEKGWSRFPANTNVLVVDVPTYWTELSKSILSLFLSFSRSLSLSLSLVSAFVDRHVVLVLSLSVSVCVCRANGVIPEFVNPAYADKSRSQFATSARLECLMQVCHTFICSLSLSLSLSLFLSLSLSFLQSILDPASGCS